ncbi:carboxypeptidase-like regulatory domain-containing protein [Flavobacterium sandaracinum]|uniref:Rhamnogalacturonan lyase domain-containing protein n=1 Tax=Flavobacterium sandaracinum TaxID=2541733 RepID=A0A4R5D383_9FLAO|nr:carboxypeptidase-like regulatory domain-containing protein [Flavobacterium sandaracinum]TDE05911.1 hypothetical protein E0F91_04830 [Flavobacterium sandaracinum]
MKTAAKFLYTLIPLYIGCGMGIQSDELDAVATKSDTIASTNIPESAQPAAATAKTYIKSEIKTVANSNSESKAKALTENSSTLIKIKSPEDKLSDITTPKVHSKKNEVKTFTQKEIEMMANTLAAFKNENRKTETNTSTTSVIKSVTKKKILEKNLKLAEVNQAKVIAALTETVQKQSNESKIFTQKEVEAMTLALTVTNKPESKLVTKTRQASAKSVAATVKTTAINDVKIAESKISETKPAAQNGVKAFTKNEIEAIAAALTSSKNTITKPTVKSKNNRPDETGIEQIKIRILNLQENYKTNKSYTLIVEIENEENKTTNLKIDPELPPKWTIISITELGILEPFQKKMILVSFIIPSENPAVETVASFHVKNAAGNKIASKEVAFSIDKNLDLEIYNVYTTSKLQAGEIITAKYEIKNKGNVEQELILSSKNTVKGEKTIKLGPNSSITIELSQATDPKYYDFITIGTFLNVTSSTSGKTYKAYGSTSVFPSKLKQTDAFFRYPLRFSINYNSNTFQDKNYSAISGELIGDGFLDLKKKNYLNFIIRAPQQQNLQNFGITDQYSLIYNYNNSTIVYLGDHGHYINRLGFDSRFGMGFRVDQNIKKWTLTAFYSKPRLYTFNSEALFGFKSVYRFKKSMLLGIAVESSKGSIIGASKNIEANLDEKGQIATSNFELRSKNTFVNAESSLSVTNKFTDHAHFLNLVQKVQNLTYAGSFTFSGKNYFGIIRNSVEYSNSLFYKINKFDFLVGQTLSQVNKRLNPLFFAAEPYFENYYARIGYRFSPRSSINLLIDKRVREDQLEPKSYFYKESGIDYRYVYGGRLFSFGLSGRIAETQNLLSEDLQDRITYSHNLDATYRFSNHLTVRGGVNHNYSNRYGISNFNENYFTYNMGLDYNFNRNFRINSTFNSGFSPEDNYLRRDFINAMMMLTIAKNHLFELRVNYFENPGSTNRKELLAFGTYTYTFGAPLKRVLEQGGVSGLIQVDDKSIAVKGIKIIAVGKSIVTNEKGIFEFNNLPLGNNYILMDESTLPFGVIPIARTPFQVLVEKDKKVELNILLVRAGTIIGTFGFPSLTKPITINLEGYIKIENEHFNYTVESNAKGFFKFQNIVPGTYKLTLIRYKGDQFFELDKEIQITVGAGEKNVIDVPVKGKERKVQFKNKNFKIGG